MTDGLVTLVEGFVPVVDLASATHDPGRRAAAAAQLDRICATSGFFTVVNHGVPQATIDAACDATAAFFDCPQDLKAAIAADPADVLMRGYGHEGEPAALETFVMNRVGEPELVGQRSRAADPALYAPNQWPELPGFRTAYLAYFAAVDRLAARIMRLFALALGLPEDWFDDRFADGLTSLAANFYPGRPVPPSGGEARKAAHTDWGTLTVLYKAETATGLQVHDRRQGWVDVPAVPDSFVINIGDLMAQWTNGRWASTVHRVVHPVGGTGYGDRYSIAFFHQPGYDTVIECLPSCRALGEAPRHASTTFGAYLTGKVRRAHLRQLLGRR